MVKIQSDAYVQWKDTLIKATKSSAATLTSAEEVITLDSSGGAFTLTLPDSTSMETGKKIWMYDNGSASTNNITIVPNGSDSTDIDGATQYVIARNNESLVLELTNSTWTTSNKHNYEQYRVVTSTVTAGLSDRFIICNPSLGAMTVNLPALSTARGMLLTVKKQSGVGISNVTIDANGAETIDGSLTATLVGPLGPFVTLLAGDNRWHIVGG